jgi:hypothetical protein
MVPHTILRNGRVLVYCIKILETKGERRYREKDKEEWIRSKG